MSRPVLAEAKLPEGPPLQKGVSLSPDIPGSSTFAKPSQEPPREPNKDDESIHRIDDADDLLKDQGRADQIDHSKGGPTYRRPGPDDTSKTKYPYRDGVPNAHDASMAQHVAQLWILRTAHELTVPIQGTVKIATRPGEVENGLNPKFQERAKTCTVTLKRADAGNLRWIFTVNCGNGPKSVKMKATRKGKTVALAKMDVKFSCSCPAWQWLGPEYHAKGESYLDGGPRGTASTPNIRDPERINRVCKHVAAVLGQVRSWTLQAPLPKKTAELIRQLVRSPSGSER